MKKVFLLFLFQTILITLFSQHFESESYTWSTAPKPYKPKEADKGLSEIGLQDKRIIEIALIGENAVQLMVVHNMKFMNSNEAIERNNKISVPYSNESSIVESKVRVIQPDGTIIELGASDIQEAQDETSKKKYRYFAVRGLIVGSVLEQLFIKKTIPNLSGVTYNMQFPYTSLNSSFSLIYPNNLVMETKSYAGYPEFKLDTSIEGKQRKYVDSTDVQALAKENYSNYNASVQRISYKISGNKSSGKMNLYSFSKWGENIFNSLNATFEKSDKKAIQNFLKNADLASANTEEEKIKCVEAFLKKNKFMSDEVDNKKADIPSLIGEKVLGKFEMTKLFCAVFNYLGISHQEVVTNDRFDEPFDPKFENYNHLQEFVIYFPNQNKYIAPTEIFYRYPLLPSGWINNYALYIKPIELGSITMGITEKKMIPALDYTYSVDTMNIDVDLTKDISSPTYHYRLTYMGYSANNLQPLFDFIPQEEKDKTRKEIVGNYVGESDEIKLTTENEGVDFLGKKPYVIDADIVSSKLTEKVGDQYLFKAGESIGRQVEMYQEGTRKLPLELEYCHAYYRNISILIPNDYKVSNLEQLNMNFAVVQDGKEVTAFKSTYTYENNILKISNVEYYNVMNLPLEQYEAFKNVVNAAADFNKIVLVLEKK